MNKQNGKRLIDTESRLVVAKGEGGWRVGEIGGGVKKKKVSLWKLKISLEVKTSAD